MRKIVLDTHVVITAFAARGLCESVFELCLESYALVVSEFLLCELKDKLSDKLSLPKPTIEEILDLYRRNSHLVEPAAVDIEACRDPEDLAVIGTCVSGGADFLVTGDKELLFLEKIEDTRIVSPRDFYDSQK